VRRLLIGLVAAFVLMAVVGVAFMLMDPSGREERRAAAWINRQPPVVPTRTIDDDEVSATGLARVLIRPDGALFPSYRWAWDRIPRSIRTAVHLPRPRDARWHGVMARAWLELHQQRYEALPILLAAATDSTRANHPAVMMLLRQFGSPNPFLEQDQGGRWGPAPELIRSLENADPAVRLKGLQQVASAWPANPDLRRRMEELAREVAADSSAGNTNFKGRTLSSSTNRGTVSPH
jgi:hypothetical protein